MKKLIGTLLASTVIFSSATAKASEFTCKSAIERDVSYHTPIVLKGSTTTHIMKKTGEAALNCVTPTQWELDPRDTIYSCILSTIIFGVVPFVWAPGAGAAMAIPALLGSKMLIDNEYNTSVTQTRLGSIIYTIGTGEALNNKQLRYLKRKYFSRFDYTNQEILDFFESYTNTYAFCPNQQKFHKTVGLTERGMEYIRAHGYKSATGLMLSSMSDDPGAKELFDYVTKRYSYYESTPYGETLNPRQMRILVREYAKKNGIRRVFN